MAGSLHVVLGIGGIGGAVIDELVRRGRRVRAVNRSGSAPVPHGVEVVAGDASDPDSVREACRDAAVVYQCANPPYHRWPELFPPLQEAAVAAAASAGARYVMADNLYMYGPSGGAPMTEDMPSAATSSKGRVRAQMADDLLAAHRSGRVEVAIGRASDYFGPRGTNSHMGERVFYPAIAGAKAQIIGNPRAAHTYSYLPDIGRALVTLGERDEAAGAVWHVPNPETVTTGEFIERIYRRVGREPAIRVMPKALLKVMAFFNPLLRAVVEEEYQLREPFVVDDRKFLETFGGGATDLDEAIAVTVEWYRANPKE